MPNNRHASWSKMIASSLFCALILYVCLPVRGDSSGATTKEGAAPAAGEQIKWQVIAGGGTRGSSTNYILSGTAGQTAVGIGTSTNYGIRQGYWQNFATSSPCLCGDANNTGSINISDAVFIINYIFGGGPAPNPICLGDANGTGNVNISDAVYIINFVFGGGPAPHCP